MSSLALASTPRLGAVPSLLIRRFAGPLDRAGELLEKPAKILRSGVAKDLLSGTWLGHPLHPMLTDIAIGSWTSSAALDAIGGSASRSAADTLVGVGVLAAIPAATTGWSDWSDLSGDDRRTGVAHAVGNLTATTAYAASWYARRRGHRGLGLAFAAFGASMASLAGYLGGHLVFARGVGVDATAFERLSTRYRPAIEESALREGRPGVAEVDGVPVFLCKLDGRIDALHDRCTHLGGPLHEGEVDAASIVCPWHGSRFRMQDGALERGPARTPQPSLRSRVREGTVEVARGLGG